MTSFSLRPWPLDAPSLQVGVLLLVPLIIVALSLTISRRRPDSEKLSSYECGFEPVGDARVRFDVLYYVVGILFLLFDLEIVLLLPYALAASSFTGPVALGAVLVLFLLLTLGFVYEWTRGALKVLSPSGISPFQGGQRGGGGGPPGSSE